MGNSLKSYKMAVKNAHLMEAGDDIAEYAHYAVAVHMAESTEYLRRIYQLLKIVAGVYLASVIIGVIVFLIAFF